MRPRFKGTGTRVTVLDPKQSDTSERQLKKKEIYVEAIFTFIMRFLGRKQGLETLTTHTESSVVCVFVCLGIGELRDS